MEDREFTLDGDSLLMRVRAQVMTREDGGWVPLGNGGFSLIGIYKKSRDDKKVEYMIVGTTTENVMRVLECQLSKDVEYHKVDPTFRHWRTPVDEKFGLTFRSPSDARAFDRGFKRAIQELVEGSSTESSLNQLVDNEYEEDCTPLSQVIEPLLPEPHEYQNVQGSSLPPPRESCGKLRDILTQPPNPNPNVIQGHFGQNSTSQHLHRVHYVSRSKSVQNRPTEKKPAQTKKYSYSHDSPLWVKSHEEWHSNKDISLRGDNLKDPYVKIVKKPPSFHEYSYPSFGGFSEDSKKTNHVKVVTSQPPSPPNKPPFPHQHHNYKKETVYSNTKRCTACQEYFNPEKNRRGACRDGTDEMNSCIEKVSCICCARGMIYHCCVTDLDDPQVTEACTCDMSNTSCLNMCQRWLGLGLLSLFVPCLWCYLPLKCCHWCGVQCGCCGARHEAV